MRRGAIDHGFRACPQKPDGGQPPNECERLGPAGQKILAGAQAWVFMAKKNDFGGVRQKEFTLNDWYTSWEPNRRNPGSMSEDPTIKKGRGGAVFYERGGGGRVLLGPVKEGKPVKRTF